MATSITTDESASISNNNYFEQLINDINTKFDTLIESLTDRKLTLVREVQSLQTDYERQEGKRLKSIQELEIIMRENKSIELENNVAIQKRTDFIKGIELELNQLKLNTGIAKLELELDTTTLRDTISRLGHLQPVTPVSIPTPVAVDYTEKITPVKSVGKKGKGPCEFNVPFYIALDETNIRVYVSDYGNSRVQVLSLDLEFITEFGKQDLKQPTGITIYGNFIFVSNAGLDEILKYELPNFKLTSRIGQTRNGKLLYPGGLASDANGDIYVAELIGNRVTIFNKDLKFNKYLGEKELQNPNDIKLSQDKVYVVDRSTPNIHIFNKSGVKLSNIIKLADGTGLLSMCIDRMGNIVVSDTKALSIQIYTQEGDLIHTIRFKNEYPLGVAVTSNQSIICAFDNNIIYLY